MEIYIKENVFIAFTSYHVFLASMIALKREKQNNILIIINDFDSSRIVEAFKISDIFSEIAILPGMYKQEGSRNSLRKKNANILCAKIKKCDVGTLFLGTDRRLESQAAAYYAKKSDTNTVVAVLDDGSDFYKSHLEGSDNKNFFKRMHSKFVIGKWYEYIRIAGLYEKTDEIHVLLPEFVNEKIKIKNVIEIDCKFFLDLKFKSFIDHYWNILSAEREKIKNIECIIIIIHSEYASKYEGYKEVINSICNMFREKGKKIGVKYHPREENEDYCELKKLDNIFLLDSEIPAEFIFSYSDNNLKFVIGDVSSALMSAKCMLQEKIKVYSNAPILKMGDEKLLQTFSIIGINLIENISEIEI